MVAAISLVIIISLSMLTTRIATKALTHTGLSNEIARFQARSALTGSGFTTAESEKVVTHAVRRRIILLLMLVGNAGLVTAISSLMLTFVKPENTNSMLYSVIIIVAGIVGLWLIAKSKIVDRGISRIIDRALERYTDLDVKDYVAILHLEDQYQITDYTVDDDDWIANKQLSESKLSDEGLNVLGIRKPDGTYIGAPDGQTKIEANDILTIYGKRSTFKELHERKQGLRGDQEHDKAVEEHQKSKESEQQ